MSLETSVADGSVISTVSEETASAVEASTAIFVVVSLTSGSPFVLRCQFNFLTYGVIYPSLAAVLAFFALFPPFFFCNCLNYNNKHPHSDVPLTVSLAAFNFSSLL